MRYNGTLNHLSLSQVPKKYRNTFPRKIWLAISYAVLRSRSRDFLAQLRWKNAGRTPLFLVRATATCATLKIFEPPTTVPLFQLKLSRHCISATAAPPGHLILAPPRHILGRKNSRHQKIPPIRRIFHIILAHNLFTKWDLSLVSCHVSCLLSRLLSPVTSPVSCLTYPVSCILSHASCLMYPVSCILSHVSCLTYPVSCFLSHVSCLTYPVSRILSHVSCLTYSVSRVLSHVSRLKYPVSRLLSHDSSLTSPVPCLTPI